MIMIDPAALLAELQRHVDADKLFVCALMAGELKVDTEAGLIYSRRFRPLVPRGIENSAGYIVFTLHFGGVRAQIKVHRAIWLAANGWIPDGFVIDHINRVKKDNRLSNLRLATTKDNSANRRSYVGTGNPANIVSEETADKIRARYLSMRSYRRVATEFLVSASTVANVVRNTGATNA